MFAPHGFSCFFFSLLLLFIVIFFNYFVFPNISTILQVCLSENECAIELTEDNFNKGLCPGATKKLAVEVACS